MPEKKIVEIPAEVSAVIDYAYTGYDGTYLHLIYTDGYGRPRIVLDTDNIGLAKQTTLSSIDGKITKCDTDNVTVVSEVAYDSANDRKKVSIENDSVGIAKEATLSSIDGKITKCDTDNIAQSDHTALKATVYSGEDTSGVVRLIRTDTTGRATVVLDVDNIGLAKETTLSSIDGKITTCNTNDIRQSDQSLLKATTYPAEDTSGVVRLLRVDTTGMVYARVVEQPVNSYTTDSITSVGNVLELDLGTFTAAGAGSSNDVYPAYRIITWQVNSNSTGAVHQVALQGSLDNSNWFDLDQSQTTGNEMRHVVNKPVRYLRANVVDMGDATEIKVLALLKDA